MLNALQTGVDGFIPQLADRLMRGQANVKFVGGRHHSSLTTGVGIRAAVMVIALVSFNLVVKIGASCFGILALRANQLARYAMSATWAHLRYNWVLHDFAP